MYGRRLIVAIPHVIILGNTCMLVIRELWFLGCLVNLQVKRCLEERFCLHCQTAIKIQALTRQTLLFIFYISWKYNFPIWIYWWWNAVQNQNCLILLQCFSSVTSYDFFPHPSRGEDSTALDTVSTSMHCLLSV